MRIVHAIGTLLLCGVTVCLAQESSSSWRTLHGNEQRWGFLDPFSQAPLRLVWRKELAGALTGPRAEVIVSGGKALIGDYRGRLHAWNARTGREEWSFQTDGPIGHSPCVVADTVFTGSMDRRLYALDLATGRERWSFQAQEGIWVSPLATKEAVLFGDRAGIFYCVDAASGEERWRYHTSAPILTTASLGSDGRRVVFGSEDMHVYCLSLHTGERIWKSRKLQGLSMRDYFPVIAEGLVFVTTNPVKDFHTILTEHQEMFLSWTDYEGEDDRYIAGTPDAIRKEQMRIRRFLEEHPEEQTFYALRLEDGMEPWVAPILYTGGLHNPMTPPCYHPETGEVFVFVRSAYGVWDGGGEVRPYTGVGRLDLRTGWVELLEHSYQSNAKGRPPGRKDMPWMTFNTIGDETQTLACAPGLLLSVHQGYIGSLNLETGVTANLYGKRDTYGGFYGPGNYGWESEGGPAKARAAGDPYGIINEWHGPGRAMISMAHGYVYYPVGSQVLCLQPESQ